MRWMLLPPLFLARESAQPSAVSREASMWAEIPSSVQSFASFRRAACCEKGLPSLTQPRKYRNSLRGRQVDRPALKSLLHIECSTPALIMRSRSLSLRQSRKEVAPSRQTSRLLTHLWRHLPSPRVSKLQVRSHCQLSDRTILGKRRPECECFDPKRCRL